MKLAGAWCFHFTMVEISDVHTEALPDVEISKSTTSPPRSILLWACFWPTSWSLHLVFLLLPWCCYQVYLLHIFVRLNCTPTGSWKILWKIKQNRNNWVSWFGQIVNPRFTAVSWEKLISVYSLKCKQKGALLRKQWHKEKIKPIIHPVLSIRFCKHG